MARAFDFFFFNSHIYNDIHINPSIHFYIEKSFSHFNLQ